MDVKDVKPKPVVQTPRPSLHDAVDLDALFSEATIEQVKARLALELKVRGLVTPEDFDKPDANQQIVASLFAAFRVDVASIRNNLKKVEN